MNKRIPLVLILLLVSSTLAYLWINSQNSQVSSWEEKKYYIGEMPPRKRIVLLELPHFNYEKIKMYTIETLKPNQSVSCSEGEFIEFQSENETDKDFACLSRVSGEIVELPIEELWNLSENATVYYSPLVIVRTPPPIEINGTEYVIGVNALYYCDPAKKETRIRKMAFYYPASDKILQFVIPVNSSLIEEFKGRTVLYVLDVVDIEDIILVAKYSPWCISS